PGPKNPALRLAKRLHGTVPVIYSASERLDAVNVRWRGQIQENAKNLAFGHVLPEMNHNEINGWTFPANARKDFSIVLLRDPADHARVALRFDAVKRILRKSAKEIHEVVGVGDSLLARMFSTIYLGDWVSYYLAMLNDVDPTPVPVIMTLKSALAAHK
ncbi:MAG: SIS domain-containing protein, partial [Candidatus Kapaibacterium sp.]